MQFGDSHIENTELEGGFPCASIRTLTRVLRKTVEQRKETSELSLFSADEQKKVGVIADQLDVTAEIDFEAKSPKDKDSKPPCAHRDSLLCADLAFVSSQLS